MSNGYPIDCIRSADRPSNEELASLMAGVVKRDRGALERLHALVRPLVTAFLEGQIQAGRLRPDELEELVQGTLWMIYRQRLSYDRQHPFRAWLLGIARHTLLERQGSQASTERPHTLGLWVSPATGISGRQSAGEVREDCLMDVVALSNP